MKPEVRFEAGVQLGVMFTMCHFLILKHRYQLQICKMGEINILRDSV